MAHTIIPEAEEILDKEFPVLDKGFVRLVDYMGGDERVVQSARVSYGQGTKNVRTDRGLIRYLMRNEHTSPFEQVQLTFHSKMPIFVARQWVRHRTARLNEISGRYSIMEPEFYVPEETQVNFQSTNNKQGRSSKTPPKEQVEEILKEIEKEQSESYGLYKGRIDTGLAKELSRINLPLSLYTQWYWNIDMHNLFHFLRLRTDSHAQKEIRDYADVMAMITKKVAPMSYEAFEDYQKNSIKFSSKENELLKAIIEKGAEHFDSDSEFIELCKSVDFAKGDNLTDKRKLTREGKEFRQKIRKILN